MQEKTKVIFNSQVTNSKKPISNLYLISHKNIFSLIFKNYLKILSTHVKLIKAGSFKTLIDIVYSVSLGINNDKNYLGS